jgi:hypothetical protein
MAKDNLEELIKELSLTAETSHELDNHMNTTTNTQVYQTLKEFDEVEFPKELHGRIMRSVYLRQFKTPLAVINTILFANLSLSVYRLWTLMGDSVQAVAGQVPTQAHSSSPLSRPRRHRSPLDRQRSSRSTVRSSPRASTSW